MFTLDTKTPRSLNLTYPIRNALWNENTVYPLSPAPGKTIPYYFVQLSMEFCIDQHQLINT